MSVRSMPLLILATLFIVFAATSPNTANASVVRVETALGDFEINLYDNGTPATVTNFLSYVQNGDYTDSIFHRSVSGFIVQSGGFRTDLNAQISAIPTNPSVENEPVFSNVRGTIAMAKLGNDPNSATSQWFINLDDNSSNLDGDNGGFTVFGEVSADGMAIIDSLAALPVFAFQSPLNELPLRNFTSTDFTNQVPVDNTHLVIVTAITVIDTTVDSAGVAGLNPTPNTSGSAGGGPAVASGGGGGSLGLFTLLGLFIFCVAPITCSARSRSPSVMRKRRGACHQWIKADTRPCPTT
jgi:peptidyl-prolyl cis-trans isomerase A (cyclophilin A)